MGRLGHARSLRRLLATPMLPFERKASPSCMGRTIVVNGRMSKLRHSIRQADILMAATYPLDVVEAAR
jgi:hypothetical protein